MDTYAFIRELIAHTNELENAIVLDGSVIADVLNKLISLEVEPGGPYIFPEIGVPDIGLNLVVGCFVRASGVELPKLDAFINQAISEQTGSVLFTEVELMDLFQKYQGPLMTPSLKVMSPPLAGPEADSLLDRINKGIGLLIESFPKDMRDRAQSLCDRVVIRNSDRQISLIAYFVRHALGVRGTLISDDQVVELGVINVVFWSAIKVYDDFWDEDESADPKLLPIANMLMRKHVEFFYREQIRHPLLVSIVSKFMDLLDSANAWETVECRMQVQGSVLTFPEKLPEYGSYVNKFYPAIGQTFGPLTVMALAGYSLGSESVLALLNYFEHCLIAMQLNDDAHDWEEDLKRGHISTAIALLLATWKEKHPTSTHIDTNAELSELAEVFWFEVLDQICDLIVTHTNMARESLSKVGFSDPSPLEWFIARNEQSAERSRSELRRTEAFMRHIGDKFSIS